MDISLNAKYVVLLKNVRDKNRFTHLAGQVFTEDSGGLYGAYLDAKAKPQGYLVLDLSQKYTPHTAVSNQHICERVTTLNLHSSD